MNKIRYAILGFAAAGLLAGCSKPGPIGDDPSIAVAQLSSLPTPAADDYASGPQSDLARPLDVLNINVFGVEELTRQVRVSGGGFFDYPLIGAVQANGRSLGEIAYELETRLAGDYVRNPDITVEFAEREGQVFTVGGEVDTPGQYPVIRQMTLLEAVAAAGGTTEYSQLNDVLVFREIEGQRYIGVYDMAAIQRGNYPDPVIYAHDVIMVGDSPNRRLMADVLRYTQLATNPLILLERTVR